VAESLDAVAAVSRTDVWAVGTLIEHWNGHKWSIQAGPKTGRCRAVLLGVTATSASAAWAVGDCVRGSRAQPIIERWNGKPKPLIEHWNGHAWRVQVSPDPGAHGAFLAGVAAVSGRNAWAVGSIQTAPHSLNSLTLIEHWTGQLWSVQSTEDPRPADVLAGIAARSGSDAWAVGFQASAIRIRTLILHWDGGTWGITSSPNPSTTADFLLAVAAVSRTNAWRSALRATVGR
jgi:hypothetical protein